MMALSLFATLLVLPLLFFLSVELFAILVVGLDILAIVTICNSDHPRTKKVGSSLMILLLPGLGFVIWAFSVLFGDRQHEESRQADKEPLDNQKRDTAAPRSLAISPLEMVFLIAAIYFGAFKIQESEIKDFANDFADEQMQKEGIEGYKVSDVLVPLGSVLDSKYDVEIGLTRGAGGGDSKSLTATIVGSCLLQKCQISMRKLELMGLDKRPAPQNTYSDGTPIYPPPKSP